jgi:acetoin utilization deacetylase AcuC-like enzyme
MPSIVVLTPVLPFNNQNEIVLSEQDQQRDALDEYNHSRQRRALILQELRTRQGIDIKLCTPPEDDDDDDDDDETDWLTRIYSKVHSSALLQFLQTAPARWEALGTAGQDPIASLSAALIPICIPLQRTTASQRPSQHVVGQMGYYCTDNCTPLFAGIVEEFERDAYLVQCALQESSSTVVLLLPTHPGHHAAVDCFGGYCYTNHAAALAAHLPHERVAILDVDYHCGNGTAAIFDSDPNVLVVSLHCDPNYDYPFHAGFTDDVGTAGTTCHLPLPPGTAWAQYKPALLQGLQRIRDFGCTACIVSLGLDTYDQDPCALRRAGFHLRDDDYVAMGHCIAQGLDANVQVLFVQEGGYRMDKVPMAATDVICGFAEERENMRE